MLGFLEIQFFFSKRIYFLIYWGYSIKIVDEIEFKLRDI